MGRNVTIDEVGNVAAFLLSDLASGITGEIMYVDGGLNTTALDTKAERDGNGYIVEKTRDKKQAWVYQIAATDMKKSSATAIPVVQITGNSNGVGYGPTAADLSALADSGQLPFRSNDRETLLEYVSQWTIKQTGQPEPLVREVLGCAGRWLDEVADGLAKRQPELSGLSSHDEGDSGVA